MNVEHDIVEGLVRTARVDLDVPSHRNRLQVPLAALYVVGQVDLGGAIGQVDLKARVGPRAVFEVADLFFFNLRVTKSNKRIR